MGFIKKKLYFWGARYFVFFANIKLNRWKPRIILVTGSSGKTTLLHLIKSQLGNEAVYSEHANSSYGIAFNILGLSRPNLTPGEWISLFFRAPFLAFSKTPQQAIYIAEADCDRPYEGDFISQFLNPEVTLWTSSTRTHSMNFDPLIKSKEFVEVEKAIAHEFGFYIQRTSKLSIVNGDNELIVHELYRTKANVEKITMKNLNDYKVSLNQTIFTTSTGTLTLPATVPKKAYYSVVMTVSLMKYLGKQPDLSFKNLVLPPGRSSVFEGVKNTTLIDSSYNANRSSMIEILEMYDEFPGTVKWAVISDMLEQGTSEQEEHEKIAQKLSELKLDRLILMGPRTRNYTYPVIKKLKNDSIPIDVFESPREVLDFLEKTISGGETILFKGGRFLEGVIEHLLKNPQDAQKLCRREKIWVIRRKEAGL